MLFTTSLSSLRQVNVEVDLLSAAGGDEAANARSWLRSHPSRMVQPHPSGWWVAGD